MSNPGLCAEYVECDDEDCRLAVSEGDLSPHCGGCGEDDVAHAFMALGELQQIRRHAADLMEALKAGDGVGPLWEFVADLADKAR